MQKPDAYKAKKNQAENNQTASSLSADLKSGNFKQIYVLYGEEKYLIRYYKNALIKAIVGDDTMNYTLFESGSFSTDEFISIADTMPFFADKRLIVLENTKVLSEKNEVLEKYFKNIPDTTYVIIVDDAVDKRLTIYKTISKIAGVYQINYQDEAYVKRWLAFKFKKNNINVTERAVDMLIGRVGIDMNVLDSESDKLLSYIDKDYIDIADVRAISSENFDNKVFDMMNAAITGKKSLAMNLYSDLLALKEEPIKILVIIGKQINKYIAAYELYSNGASDDMIRNKTGVYYFGKLARSLTKEKLETALERYIEMDYGIKSGNLTDELAVELMIIYLSM